MLNKPNLLVLGASGGVANAFLHHLTAYRKLFGKLILLDKRDKLLKDQFVDHQFLDYKFILEKIELPRKEKRYLNILKKYKINIVLDITDENSTEILDATNKTGISYVNTSMNNYKKTVKELISDIFERRDSFKNASHILCTGMNPGVVNMWVRYGIEKFGVPKEVVHFEYDTSKTIKKWYPSITWSAHEFLVESINDPTGIVLGRGNVKDLLPNALKNRESMKPILKPILNLKEYPYGMTVLHEENLSVGYKYNIPSKFIYSITPETIKSLVSLYNKKKKVFTRNLKFADNTTEPLEGSDNIGVMLEYPEKRVYYFNSIPNTSIIGTNATYTQVIVGVFAALFVLMFNNLKPGVYFVEDLYDTYYKYFLFDNMRVQQIVFKKMPNQKLKLLSYDPMVKIKRNDHFKHFYII
jgi:homospermidine synthase